jgi:diguanylate cyclase (GGDEF)-like protein
MPETDMEGAKVIAERIRKEVEAAVFDTELGPLKVTISLGVSTVPDVANAKQEMIDKADQSLYFAKHHGRNRSVTVLEMEAGAKKVG